MRFVVCGPYEVPRRENGTVDKDRGLFWKNCEDDRNGLPDASGCYIFALKSGRGTMPWYVGKAEKQRFKSEIFAPHKLLLYNEILSERRGTPLVYFLPKVTLAGKLCRPSKRSRASIPFLETMLMSYAYRRNNDLKNVSKTKFLRELEVAGLISAGKRGHPGVAALNLRDALGLQNSN